MQLLLLSLCRAPLTGAPKKDCTMVGLAYAWHRRWLHQRSLCTDLMPRYIGLVSGLVTNSEFADQISQIDISVSMRRCTYSLIQGGPKTGTCTFFVRRNFTRLYCALIYCTNCFCGYCRAQKGGEVTMVQTRTEQRPA